MRTKSSLIAFFLLWIFLVSFSSAALSKESGPPIGSLAPELKDCRWLQLHKTNPVKIHELGGKVVLIHTFAFGCDPCMRRGVPLLGSLLRGYDNEDLTAISFTAYNPELQGFVAENKLEHSIALVSIIEKSIPYVDVSKNGLTYIFIIGRNGKIRWRGDYVVKEREFLKALWKALREEPVPPLEKALHPALDQAVSQYRDRSFVDAKNAAAKIKIKYGKKKDSDSADIVRDADCLIDKIDEIAVSLINRMEEGKKNNRGLAFVKARELLAAEFPKTEAADRAKALGKESSRDKSFSAELMAAQAWTALLDKYPVLFPVEKNAKTLSFLKKLTKFIKSHEGSTAAEEAKQLLDRHTW